MIELIPTRIELFKRLRPGCLVAEVGTWRGYLAIEILNTCPVGRLFCIDPWEGQQAHYADAPKTDAEQDADYRETLHHLRGHIPGGRVRVIRGYSVEVARNDRSIPPLDMAYIDAAHDYDSVLSDLEAWLPRLKSTGVLAGHDYTTNDMAMKHGWGVKKAVADFCEKHRWEIRTLTAEDFASFELRRL